MPVIDTHLLIGVERGDEKAILAFKAAAAAGTLIIPAVAALEYLDGVAQSAAELRAMHESMEVRHTTDDLLTVASQLRADARKKGVKARWADILIAAEAVLAQTYVVSTNKRHFTQLGVPAWNYETEKGPPA